MLLRILLAGLILALPLALSASSPLDDKNKDETEAPVNLALEINVLRTLYYLQATPEQAQALLKDTKDTAGKDKEREPGKVSEEYHRLLTQLRDALAADDEEAVETLEDKLEELTINDAPELDDEVPITDAARKRAPAVLKQFRAQQVASFIGLHADQISDPRETLQSALDQVRRWQLGEWQAKRDALGDELAKLIGGVDAFKSSKVRESVIDLLARARTLKEDDFVAKRGALEREAQTIAAQAGPIDVLRNFAEHALAEMLSNPRLEPALKARTKEN
jgi:small-conductance mechanosensitive channel